MALFGFRNEVQRKLDELKAELEAVKNIDWKLKIAEIETHLVSLRNLVNRKLSKEKDLKQSDPLKEYGLL